jgi:hypothetical protein
MSLTPSTARVSTGSTDQTATDPSAAARSTVRDLQDRLRATTARLTRLRAGIRAEVTDLITDGDIDPADANAILRRLSVRPVPQTFHCYLNLPITINVSAAGDAPVLRQAQRILAEGVASLAQITIRREPDCFGIDPPRATDDGQVNRLVHTTVPLTVTVAAAEQRSVWPAVKRRLSTQLRRLPSIRADIGAIGKVHLRAQDSDDADVEYV